MLYEVVDNSIDEALQASDLYKALKSHDNTPTPDYYTGGTEAIRKAVGDFIESEIGGRGV